MSNMIPLEQIRIASPCHADWAAMQGDDRARYCGDCRKNVYNLSAMRREEAEALIREREGNLCVRYYQRRDGTILTADCPVGVRVRRRRALLHAGAVVSVLASVSCAAGDRKTDPQAKPVPRMGRIIAKSRPAKAHGQPAKAPAPQVKMGEPPTVKQTPPQLMGKPAPPKPNPPALQGTPLPPKTLSPGQPAAQKVDRDVPPLLGKLAAPPAVKGQRGGFGEGAFMGGIGAGPLPRPQLQAPLQPAAPHQEPV